MNEPTHDPPSHPHEPPATNAADEDLLAALADDFAARARRNERPSAEEYVAKHPALAERIRQVLQAVSLIEESRTVDLGTGERPGSTIGRYKLLERIGEGGFGVVYMAEQHQPVRRRVALKVVKPGMDSRQVLARFEAERQALAIMDHPNIAKVFDGGMTDSGRPYFVMELVKGEPITDYCDRAQLTPRQRLELFAQVCHAVQHAHQKGVIHRDLKPSNVLVAVHDTTPVVKVIDFGVAKALGQELTEKTLFTGFAQLVGTPLYMSPEQAGQSSLDVDTRSDIYSLGVLLYELLTGTTPFDKERFKRAAQEEIRRIIREEEPPRPSTRLSESKDSLPSISAQRHMEPAKLTKLVRGELDWIVMRALEKDRTRRYETANGLARDIERFMSDEPVQACPPSTGYRLRKFTHRHRVPLAVAAGFVSLLVAAVVVSTSQAIRIRSEQQKTLAQKLAADRERDRAVAAEQKAVSEARKSEQVAAFMTEMLRGVGPSVALGRDTTMLREILDNTSKRLDGLKGQPAVEADLRMVLGGVYTGLGEDERAEAMYRAALALRRELLGNKHADVARTLVVLSEPLGRQRRFAEAEAAITEGLAMRRELLGKDHWDVGWALFYLGLLENRRGRHAEAETHLKEALAILRQRPNPDINGLLGQLALSLTRQRKYAEAEPIHRECIERGRKKTPSGSPDLSTAIYNLGVLFFDQHKYAEAEPYFREALEMQRKQLPADHPNRLFSMRTLARCLIARGRAAEAVPLIDDYIRLGADKPAMQAPLPEFIALRMRHFQNANDAPQCRASAEMWERLNRTDARYLYDAARYRAVTAAAFRVNGSSPQAAKDAVVEADRAMDWLGKAVAAGFVDVDDMKRNKDLDALRDRDDFRKLLGGLEAKTEENIGAAPEVVGRERPSSPHASSLPSPVATRPTTAGSAPARDRPP